MGEYLEAQDALAEANIQNYRDPLVWGWITLLCLRTNRETEAQRSFNEATKWGISNVSLLK